MLAALVGGLVVWRMVDERSGAERGYRVYAMFANAQGLVAKSRVTVAGIPVGYIQSIRLEGALARIDMVVQSDVPLYDDASVSRRSATLLGGFLLSISPGTPGQRQLVDGDEIRAVEETPDTADIMDDVGAIAASVRAVAGQVERVFGTDEGGRQMASALSNLTEALEAVNRTIRTNEEAVNNTLSNIEDITTRAAPRLDDILANLDQITSDVRSVIRNNREGLNEGVAEVGPTISSINRAAQQLELVLEDVGEITGRTAAGEGTVGRLTSDENLIDEVEEVAENVNDIVGGLARLRTVIGLRSEYLFLTNAFKNYLDIRIAPSEDRYFFIQLVDDPRGATTFSQTVVQTSPPKRDEPASFTEIRQSTTQSLLFSLQLAKRIYWMTLRFGILESSGAIGMDLNLFDDRFEINADLFRFNEQVFPNLRIRLAYEIVPTLFVLGGVDNILNSDFTAATLNGGDFFLGAMLRFTDHDLTGLIPFLGGAIPSN